LIQRRHIVQLLVFAAPLVLALLLYVVAVGRAGSLPGSEWLKPLQVNSVAELERLFTELGYDWPLMPGAVTPRVMLKSLPAELNDGLSIERKKSLFLRILLPVVLAENEHIRQQRAWLLMLLAEGPPPVGSLAWQELQQLAADYGIKGELRKRDKLQQLLRRVDEIPVALVLAQAANESGWGTSRFVRKANNLFGHWTYRADQGLVPLQRDAGKQHRVRVFPSLRLSVRAYLHNLNTSRAYRRLRQLRTTLRDNKQPLDGEHLAAGLINYSERGEVYVEEIRGLIRSNELEKFESMRLREGTWRLSDY